MTKNKLHKIKIEGPEFSIIVEGPISSDFLNQYSFHDGLNSFRPSSEQQGFIAKIANQPEGKVIIVHNSKYILGYVVFSYPDQLEYWSKGKMNDLLELGVIEVASPFRGKNLGKKLLEVAFKDETLENYIVFTTLYYWHWDLKGTGLTVWQYRKMMEKVMGSVGLKTYATNEAEISSHPANALMARIGKNVPASSIELFEQLRYGKIK